MRSLTVMKIQLKDLELRPVEFDQLFSPESINLGSEVRLKNALKADGRAEMIEEHHGGKKVVRDIRVRGHLEGDVIANCDRCLTDLERHVEADFDVLQRPQSENTGADEYEIHEGDTEIGFYEGDAIVVEDVLKEQVLLAMPAKMLCTDECKGLCPQCGHNRNTEDCRCEVSFQDPRWAALGELRKKLQN